MYSFLFYKVYVQVLKSKNWKGIEKIGACLIFFPIIFMHLLSIYLILLSAFNVRAIDMSNNFVKIFIVVSLVGLTYLYYSTIKSIKFLHEKFDNRMGFYKMPGWLVYTIYFIISVGILILCSMFKNDLWIF